MKVSELMACSFSTWYPLFKKVTIPSCIIPLPQNFVDYLNADGVVIPNWTSSASQGKLVDAYDVEDDEDDVNWDEEGDAPEAEAPSFPEFEEKIRAAIAGLGGEVFPKLNWSAPQDASWIAADKTLRCSHPEDLFLLLKSSTFISHDLTMALEECEDCEEHQSKQQQQEEPPVRFELVLRRWTELQPGLEFRCFVKNKKLIGISQRNNQPQMTDYIKKQEDDIYSDIVDFFSDHLEAKFPEDSYVFDVYRGGKSDVLLIDFNPFCHVTDPLLFSWAELDSLADTDQKPRLRYGEAALSMQPKQGTRYGVPVDFRDLAAGEDPYKLRDFLSLKIQRPDEEVSSDDDDEATGS